jgi:hypothetical protein
MRRRAKNDQIFNPVPPFIPILTILKNTNPPLSEDKQAVVDKLRELLERAEEGKITGLCFSVSNVDKTFEAECVGCYDKYPTDALGPLDVLKLKLTRKALDEQWLQGNS